MSVNMLPTDVLSGAKSHVENSEENGVKAKKRKISLSNCSVCGSDEAKYRCPACLTLSCSLLCVKKHKEAKGCSGVRNKTGFVALLQFDEMTLLSDYRFLEDTGRFADSASRDSLIRVPRTTFKTTKLTSSARKMNITLRCLPVTFTKNRENSTIFLTKQKQFLWHLKLIFPQSSTEFSQMRVADSQTLEQILTSYIHPTESDPVIRQKLKMYVHSPFDHVKVFMKDEGRKANSIRYHELDVQQNLRENLSYKTLIEYPVLHVVLRDHWEDYPLKAPGENASPCSSLMSESQREVQKMEENEEKVISPPLLGSAALRAAGIGVRPPESNNLSEPPQQKRPKREIQEDELEEGEIVDSSDEDEGSAAEHSRSGACGDGAKSQTDTEGVNKGVDVDHKNSNCSSTHEGMTVCADNSWTVSETPVVSVTQEDE
ncbi:box C/D snoRNA protein 1 [Thalassophryne amazonica]|uniref:box C/D snoRNA protein 1 n=1 Tax=Thalassophryne amazonica TaxID=390379 RepID=UPI001471ACF3|nr:box C/D snoRNA protein 1 [Thalassophryne amazonica]